MKLLGTIILVMLFAFTSAAQRPSCGQVQTGRFKMYTKETGTTYITRTTDKQTEKNDDIGFEVVFSVKWTDDCTCELRPEKLIKGDPSLMGDGTHVLKMIIKEVTADNYTAEISANFAPVVMNFKIDIIR
jgi:hypothetical protein